MKSFCSKAIASGLIDVRRMLAAINLDNQAQFEADEIKNIALKRNLAAEFEL